MKPTLEELERTVGDQLTRALSPTPIPPGAVERMRRRMQEPPGSSRPGGRWVRRLLPAVAAAAVLLLMLLPAVRTFARDAAERVRETWSGKVGATQGSVQWHEVDIRQSRPPVPPGPTEEVATVAEAAGKVGFQPVETTLPGAKLEAIRVNITAVGEYETRWVSLEYRLSGRLYHLLTMTHYRKVAGIWKAIPQTRTVAYAASLQPVQNTRTIAIGQTEGLAYEISEPAGKDQLLWRTDVTWLPAGNERIVRLSGLDPATVEAIAKATTP